MRANNYQGQRVRSGFTLAEMLVVILIIGILVTLTAAAVSRFSSTGPALATQSNLDKIRASLDKQWLAVRDGAETELMSSNGSFQGQAMNNIGAAGFGDPRIRPEYVRLKIIQAFPTTFAEALYLDPNLMPATPVQPNPVLAWPAYQNYLAKYNILYTNPSTWITTPPQVQQAICLLMILQKGPKNTGLSTDDLGGSSVLNQFSLATLPANSTATALVDSWGRPILLTRRYAETPPMIPKAGLMPVWQDKTLALLSAGRDGNYGLNDYTTFVVGAPLDARDNLLSTAVIQTNYGLGLQP
jgi:prepilin-type N-terminal cleavage/methylation domain-containing protein